MKVRTRAPTSRAGKAVDAFLCLRARGNREGSLPKRWWCPGARL